MSEIIAKVVQNKSRFNAVDAEGNKVDGISASLRRKAFDANKALQRAIGKTGRPFWRLVNIEELYLLIPSLLLPLNVMKQVWKFQKFLKSTTKSLTFLKSVFL